MAQNDRNNVLVVGGSSGVGLASAKLALTQLPNSNVIISSSNKEKLEKATKELQDENKESKAIIDYVVGDVSNFETQFDDVEGILKAATVRFNGRIDHIVWTAGKRPEGNSDKRSNEDIIETSTTRLYGPMTLIRLAKEYMTDTRHSSITLTSGVLVYRPMKGRGRTTAGGGMETGARGLAVDLAPIRVNAIVLGAIQTPLLDGLIQGNKAMADHLAQRTLVQSIGSAAEAAEAYLFSMRCAYVTGSRIDVEGGWLLV